MLSIKDMKSEKLEKVLSEQMHNDMEQQEVNEDDLFVLAEYDDKAAEKSGYSNYSYWSSTLRVFFKNKVAVFLLIVLALLLMFTFLQPYLPGQYPANLIVNHPQTGMQLSNMSPSMTTVFTTAPAGTQFVPHDGYYATDEVLLTLARRTKFNVIEYGSEWCKVVYTDGSTGVQTTGYVINNDYTKLNLPDDPTAVPYESYSSKSMNLYGKPVELWYAVDNVLGTITRGNKFTIVEYGEDWCKIEFKDQVGYVQNNFQTKLKLPEDPTAVPYQSSSNYKINLYSAPVDYSNGGNALYAKTSAFTMTEDGMAVANDEVELCIIPTSHAFWFGTNNIGQDLWARVWSGTRTSLFIGFAVAIVEAIVGILVGVMWGYIRQLDRILTEVYNVVDNIPNTIILILISYIMKPSMQTLIFAMCLTGWLGMARFIRNQIVIIRDRDYNMASRCLGTSTWRIIMKNLLPYLVSVITLRMALSIPGAIGSEVFITYIGLGLPVDTPSLGNLINEGRKLITSPTLMYQLIFPTIVLSIVTISFYIIGNAFADAADPKNHV